VPSPNACRRSERCSATWHAAKVSRRAPWPAPATAAATNGQARGNCPPQYARQFEGPDGPIYSCDYTGAVAIHVDGVSWARTWWNFDGNSVTEFTLAAKKGMSAWDSKFDDDYAAWLAAQPPSPPPCLSC